MTIKEALEKSGTLEALPGAAIDAADQMIEMGEKVRCAVAANCSVADMWANGILAVTSHRVLFCSGTVSQQLLLRDCVGLGDIAGRAPGTMKISAEGTAIIVELSKEQLEALQSVILEAVAEYPNQPPIDFRPGK